MDVIERIRSGLPEVERRFIPHAELRVDDGSGDAAPKIKGMAAMFDKLSADLGGFREKIAPGAFAKTLQEADVRALWNHNPDFVLGRSKSGTLELAETDRGLAVVNEPPDTTWARDLLTTMRRGDVDQMSFGFQAVADEWDNDPKIPVRTLKEVKLFDVSVVTFPAYPQTSVKVRSVLVQAGIDFDALASLLARRAREIPIGDGDRELLRQSITVLNSYLAGAEPGETHSESESETQAGRSVLILRRRLELEEISI